MKAMKLKLIAPKCDWGSATNKYPPYVLATLAGLTPSDIDVVIEDQNVEEIDYDEPVDLVGITVIVHTAKNAFLIADEFRKRGVTTFMGGVFVEACPDECLEHADSVILCEVEDIWADILQDFSDNNYKKCYRSDKRPEIAGLPLPRHDLLKKKGYLTNNLIMISKGCLNRCQFCTGGVHWKGQVKTRDIDDIINEIKSLDSSQPFIFLDDNLIWNEEYAKEIFRALIPLKIQWICSGACVDCVEDMELIQLAKDSGCLAMLLGFETVNEVTLKASGKGFNKVEKYKTTIENFHKVGIAVQGAFIFGLDGDTVNTIKDTVSFIENSDLDMLTLNMLYPYPGTPFRDKLIKENRLIIDENEWDNFTYNRIMFQPKSMTIKELANGFKWATIKLASKEACSKRLAAAVKYDRAPEYIFDQNMQFRRHVQKMYGEWSQKELDELINDC